VPVRPRQKLHLDVECDLASAWQKAPLALAVVGPEGMLAWNDSCQTLLCEMLADSEVAGRRWLSAAVVRLLAAGQQEGVLGCGSDELGLDVKMSTAGGLTGGHVLALRRVTEPDSRRESLAETVSTLSHELRTPLASMKSSLGLVLAGEAGTVTGDQQHFLGMTMRNINRLERLVSDLLDVSGQDKTQPADPNRETDLGPVLREAVQMQATVAAEAGLDFDGSGLPETLSTHLDPDKVTQILANIVSNALKYTPAGGLVRVWAEVQQPRHSQSGTDLALGLAKTLGVTLNTWRLVVQDSGPGLSVADQERIFEPWFRGSEQERESVPGAGLGLSITRSLIAAHGGSIRLLSAPGQGTTVWTQLPCDLASEKILQATGKLNTLLDRHPDCQLAVLDGRQAVGRGVAELAADFQSQWPGLATATVISPLADVVVAIVAEPTAWSTAWREFVSAENQDGQLAWRFPAWIRSKPIKESMEYLSSRNL